MEHKKEIKVELNIKPKDQERLMIIMSEVIEECKKIKKEWDRYPEDLGELVGFMEEW